MHHTIDWIHKYRKYKTKYFELKQHMGLRNQLGGSQDQASAPPLNDETDTKEDQKGEEQKGEEQKGEKQKGEKLEGETLEEQNDETLNNKDTADEIKNLITINAMGGAQPTCGKISPGGLFILVGYSNGQLCIYILSTGEMILNTPLQTQCSRINDVDWADGSMLFVVAGDIDETYEPAQMSVTMHQIHYNGIETLEEDIAAELTNIVEFENVKNSIEIMSSNLHTNGKSVKYIHWKKNLIIAGYNDTDTFKILLFDDNKEPDNIEVVDSDSGNKETDYIEDNETKIIDVYDDNLTIEDTDTDTDTPSAKLKGGSPAAVKGEVAVGDGDGEVEGEVEVEVEVEGEGEVEGEVDADMELESVDLDVNVEQTDADVFKFIEEHTFKVKGKGMSFNADATKLAIILDDDSNTIVFIDVTIDGSPILVDKEYIIKSNIKPKKITINDNKLLLLGDGLEEIDISVSISDAKPIEPQKLTLENLTDPIVFSYNPVTKNELLVCSQDKLCIYNTVDKVCKSTIQHNLEPTINSVDWHFTDKRFFITITEKDIRVWCMDCNSGKENRHITCNESYVCIDDKKGSDTEDITNGKDSDSENSHSENSDSKDSNNES